MSRSCNHLFGRGGLIVATAVFLAGLVWMANAPAAGTAKTVPAARITATAGADAGLQTAVLAGGCFWGMEAVFEHVKGVTDVISGYAGGAADTANYHASSSGRTGHAEAVKITYDPHEIAYTDLLRIYFSVAHDPTQINRQGPDRGSQYRSAIFPVDAEQARLARAYIAQLDKARVFDAPIATEVSPSQTFYPAESYHQNYAELHPDNPYIRINDAPKIEALKTRFAKHYRQNPVALSANR